MYLRAQSRYCLYTWSPRVCYRPKALNYRRARAHLKPCRTSWNPQANPCTDEALMDPKLSKPWPWSNSTMVLSSRCFFGVAESTNKNELPGYLVRLESSQTRVEPNRTRNHEDPTQQSFWNPLVSALCDQNVVFWIPKGALKTSTSLTELKE